MPTKNFKNYRILLRIPNFVIFPDKMPSLGVYKNTAEGGIPPHNTGGMRYGRYQRRRYAVRYFGQNCDTGNTGGTVFKGTLVPATILGAICNQQQESCPKSHGDSKNVFVVV